MPTPMGPAPGKYSPTLRYLQLSCALSGLFFGHKYRVIGHSWWRSVLCLSWHVLSTPLVMFVSSIVYGGRESFETLNHALASLKPVSLIVYLVTQSCSLFLLLFYTILLPYNGERILRAANHRLFAIFDGQTNLRPKFICYSELIFVVIVLAQNFFWILIFLGVDKLRLVPMMLIGHLIVRKQVWLFQVQAYVLVATNHWLDRLLVVASRGDIDRQALLLYVHLTTQLLECVQQFYAALAPYLVVEQGNMFATILLTFLLHMVGFGERRMIIMFTITSSFHFLGHLFLVWLAFHRLCAKLARLRSVLVRQAINLRAPPHIRLWCLGSAGQQDLLLYLSSCPPPPEVAGLFRIDLYSLLTMLIFVFDFSWVLYQTEHM